MERRLLVKTYTEGLKAIYEHSCSRRPFLSPLSFFLPVFLFLTLSLSVYTQTHACTHTDTHVHTRTPPHTQEIDQCVTVL